MRKTAVYASLALGFWGLTAAVAGGFDPASFRGWVELRLGSGAPVYWYATGTVYAYPSGEPLLRVEGIETARLAREQSSATQAHQLSRKTFIYRDLTTNAVVREWRGQALPAIAYPYQYITYELKGSVLETWVEQGRGAQLQKIGPGRDMTARRIGNTWSYSAPLFLDLPMPNGRRLTAFEHYDFFLQPNRGKVTYPQQISWLRFGELPAGIGAGVMHMVAWRVSSYADLPASIREYIDTEAPLWQAPPKNLADIRAMQQ